MKPLVVHVAQIEIAEDSGMGRVAWHWKREFERRGYEFIHIGSESVGSLPHPALFPYAAYRAYRRIERPADILLVHEPASGVFARRPNSTIVFSHGLERRSWQLGLKGQNGDKAKIRLRTRILFPLWRLRQCDIGLRRASSLLLINREDAAFAQNSYRRKAGDMLIFNNGVNPSKVDENVQPPDKAVLFLGSWLKRKGIETLVEAARILAQRDLQLRWLLAGTGLEQKEVLRSWPEHLHSSIEVIPTFTRETEEELFARSSLLVLPSFFEGQPLALLQAMEAGRCCITTNCCGQRDLIQDQFNGLLHEPGDAITLADLIARCLDNQELRLALGRNAKRSVQGRSWEVVSAEVADFVEATLKLNNESHEFNSSNCAASLAGS
jgi:glycosyltransferase involved in cell wall biosynthesis